MYYPLNLYNKATNFLAGLNEIDFPCFPSCIRFAAAVNVVVDVVVVDVVVVVIDVVVWAFRIG